jgi:hypothetical protein
VPPATDEYTLTAQVDDGARVWLDGELVIDDVKEAPAREVSHKRRLEGGRRYELRVEYVEFGGGATMRLQWSTPALAPDRHPPDRPLSPGRAGGGGAGAAERAGVVGPAAGTGRAA